MAFFPCVYFECMSMMMFSWDHRNYRALKRTEAIKKIIEREQNRTIFYQTILKFIYIIEDKGLRLIIENPYSEQHFFKQGNFVKKPDYYDKDRSRRGDFFIKPTAYWFFGCEPTIGFTEQHNKKIKNIPSCKPSTTAGLCSEERSMISPDYARNFICDQILGIEQDYHGKQLNLF